MSAALASLFGVGHLRPGPGTWGSLAALPLAWAVHALGGPILLIAATVAVTAAGWWAVAEATRGADDHDPSWIVIDEVAGQWVALWPVSIGAAMRGADVLALWPGILVAFLAFRAFDIWKPGPVGWADAQPGARGVMLDDLVAGWLASLVVAVAAFVAHGIMGV